MEPAYRDGDRVLVNRLAYRLRPPRVGDVVVLRDPERTGKHLLKRVAVGPEGGERSVGGMGDRGQRRGEPGLAVVWGCVGGGDRRQGDDEVLSWRLDG